MLTYHQHVWHYRDETVSRNEWDGEMNAIFRAEEIWFAAETNTSFPKLDGIQRWSWNWDSHWKEIWKPVETNTIQHFPKLDGFSLPASSVFGRFQTLCEEKNTQKPIQQWVHMYGRANLSKNATFKHLSLIWGPLKIPHHGEGGCGSRLSIWWWLV